VVGLREGGQGQQQQQQQQQEEVGMIANDAYKTR
jgi:hypothetical protein